MKKAIVLLLALAVIGGAVFAQDAPALKFSGYVSTGVNYNMSQDDLSLLGYYNGYTNRVRFNADYMDGDFGVHFRYQANGLENPKITQALVKFGFLDSMLKFKVGVLDDYTVATYDYYGKTDGMEGAQLFLAPVAGLTVSAFLPVTQAGGVTFSDAFNGAMFAAKYSAEGIGDFYAGFANEDYTALGTRSAWLEAEITAIENLDAIVEMHIADLTTIEPYFVVDVSYVMGALTLGLYNEDGVASTLYWLADPYVSYAVTDKVTLGGDASYDSDDVMTAQGYIKYMATAKAAIRAAVGYDGTDVYFGTAFDFTF